MDLSVLPGAKTSFVLMLLVSPVRLKSAGVSVGHCAIARIAPVCGFITMIEQLRAWNIATRAWHSRSAEYWMSALIVRRRLRPPTTGVVFTCVIGIGSH